MRYKIIVTEDREMDLLNIYGYGYGDEEGKSYYLKIKDGFLEFNLKKEGEFAKEPLLILPMRLQRNEFLDALTEGLRRAGFVAEVDNTQRITAEARNNEKEGQIKWLREQLEKQLEKK